MLATKLYAHLEKDFIKPSITDNWAEDMKHKGFLSDNFKERSMGVVCDNSLEIKRVYTAVFPTDAVLNAVAKTRDSLLFVHHPEAWDLSKPEVFQEMNQKLLMKLKQHRVSIYNLHAALDNFGAYSTSTTLARAIGIKGLKPFDPYHGGLAGVFGTTKLRTAKDLSSLFSKVVGHKTSFYQYGDCAIKKGVVAVVAGGGNDVDTIKAVVKLRINTLVTGVTVLNSYSQQAHELEKNHKINVLGGTHYSTEKFACMEMCKYFRELGLPSKFIAGKPGLKDL